MLLELKHIAVGIVDEELQYVIGASAPDLRLEAVASNNLSHALDILDFKGNMTKQTTRRLGGIFVEELEEGAVVAAQEDAIELAGGIAELVRNFAAQQIPVEIYRPRQVGRAKADV